MSTAARLYAALETLVNGAGVVIGDRNNAEALTFAGNLKYESSFSITNSSGDNYNSQTLWATGDGGVDTFEFLWLEADAAAIVEIQNDNSDAVIFSLVAGVPLILGADDLIDGALGADGSATTVAQVIDRIKVKNNTDGSSADVTVTGRLVLFD